MDDSYFLNQYWCKLLRPKQTSQVFKACEVSCFSCLNLRRYLLRGCQLLKSGNPYWIRVNPDSDKYLITPANKYQGFLFRKKWLMKTSTMASSTFGTYKVFKNLIGLFEIAKTSKASPLPFEDWQPWCSPWGKKGTGAWQQSNQNFAAKQGQVTKLAIAFWHSYLLKNGKKIYYEF